MSRDPLAIPPRLDEVSSEHVIALVRRHAPSFWSNRTISADLRLDDAGIGFDSVDLLDLLVDCERELGLELPQDLLLDDAITVGDLILKLQGAAAAS